MFSRLFIYAFPPGIRSFWDELSSSQQPESKEAVVGFRAHCICQHLSFSFNEVLQERRLQPGCARSSSPATGAMDAGKARGHTAALAMLPLPRLLPRYGGGCRGGSLGRRGKAERWEGRGRLVQRKGRWEMPTPSPVLRDWWVQELLHAQKLAKNVE